MKHTIEVNGIKIYAFHGCLPEEEKIGGHYTVDVMLNTDFTLAALNDDLDKTIDYVDVNRIVCEEMAIRSKLIEHVGQRILDRFKKEIENMDDQSREVLEKVLGYMEKKYMSVPMIMAKDILINKN
jgi:dihydroneopterin aldolase